MACSSFCFQKIKIIPEEVLHQIYENFDLFPAPLERLFRLQLVIGCRIGELLKMPRQCLKKEADKWFLLRWIEKRKHWKFFQIHPLVTELVQEQQKFLDTQIEEKLNFNRLFYWLSAGGKDLPESEKRDVTTGQFISRGGRFDVKPVYKPEPISLAIISLGQSHQNIKSNSRVPKRRKPPRGRSSKYARIR